MMIEKVLLNLRTSGKVDDLKVYLDKRRPDREVLFPTLYATELWTNERQSFYG